MIREAINELKKYTLGKKNTEKVEISVLKLNRVIKALEQESCEDAISREDALMALTGEWTELTDEIIHRFIKRIKKLPPVTPQPTNTDGMTALTKEERENRKNILERISERMVPVSVIKDIKKQIDKEYKWLMSTKHSLYDIDIAFDRIKGLIDKHISEKEKE